MSDGICPDPCVLEDYALGILSLEAIESVGQHIEQCSQCQARVAEFDDDSEELVDRWVARSIGNPFAGEAERESALARAMAAIDGAPIAIPGAEAPSDACRHTGSRLGGYELLEPIGSGGMGTVYRARHVQMNRFVAIKFLPRWCQADVRAIERFQREITLVAQLDHPHIVRAFDACEKDGERFLVMEYVAGMDLSELVRRCGPLPLADACELVRQAAEALQYVHTHQLIHRDVKPSNLMLAEPGQVKLLDLGLAFVSGCGGELTDPGQLMGTLDYMAPEQASDSHAIDGRVDVYGLGATLCKMLCGEAPLAGSPQRTPAEKLAALTRGRTTARIRRRRPEVPRALAAVVRLALSKNPNRRYGTPLELARALEPFCAGHNLAALLRQAMRQSPCASELDQSAVSTSRLASHASAQTVPATPSRAAPDGLPLRRRFKKAMVWTCTGAAAIAILAGVTIVIRHHGQETTIQVPDNSRVQIDVGTDDQVRVELAKPDAAVGSVATPPAAAPPGWCRDRCDASGTSYYPRPTSKPTSHQLEAVRWSPARLLGRVDGVVAGDLTGDGFFEVVLRDGYTVVALDRWAGEIWRRDPVVDSGVQLPAGRIGWASEPELADFDNDGAFEVVVLVGSQLPDGWSTKAPQYAVIYDGDGSVLRRFPVLDGCFSIPSGCTDFNADGYPDIVFTTAAYRHPHAVCIYDSVTGQLLCRVDVADAPAVAGIKDIDDDGQLDLLLLQSFTCHVDPPVTDYDSHHCYAVRYDRQANRLWVQAYDNVIDGCLTDMEGDGMWDLVLIKNTASGGELSFLDPKTGTTRSSFAEMAATGCRQWSIADMDGDGAKEFIVSDGENLLIIGAQAQLVARSAVSDARVLATNDLDGDAHAEIVAKQQCDLVVFNGELKELARYTTPMPIFEAIIADLDGDGVNEVFIVGEQDQRSSVTVLHFAPQGSAATGLVTQQPWQVVDGCLRELRAANMDQAMNYVLADRRDPIREQLAAVNLNALPAKIEYQQLVRVDDANVVIPGEPTVRFTLRYADDRWWIVGVVAQQKSSH